MISVDLHIYGGLVVGVMISVASRRLAFIIEGIT